MIIQLKPFAILRGTVVDQRDQAAKVAHQKLLKWQADQHSRRSRAGWATRRGGKVKCRLCGSFGVPSKRDGGIWCAFCGGRGYEP